MTKASKKTRRNPLDGIDPAVASVLGEAERRQKIRRLPRDEQERARQQAKRPRVMLDIPPVVQDEIDRIAQREGLSVSAVVTLLLADAICRYDNGKMDFGNTKRMSRSPRYEWALRDGVAEDILAGKINLTEDSENLWR